MTKPYDIPKALVWEAYQSVKANGGSAGIDRESLEQFESRLSGNLYKLWNRMFQGVTFRLLSKACPSRRSLAGYACWECRRSRTGWRKRW
jgi:RNA-directed DNA polymerase